MDIEINGVKLKQLGTKDTIRILGLFMNPSLRWDKQYKVMLDKLKQSITTLMSSKINAFQAFIYFNMYMMHSMYFGYCAININKTRWNEICKVYEATMTKKLNLSMTFPRKLLYTHRTAIGIGLLQPHTIVAIAILKQYIGNLRTMRNIRKIIVANKELIAVKASYSGRYIEVNSNRRYWK